MQVRSLIVCLTLLLALPPAVLAARMEYHVVPSASHLTARVASSGVFGFAGHEHAIQFDDVSGDASVTGPPPSVPASLRMTVRARSLRETGKFKDADRQAVEDVVRKQVLEVDKYP